MKQILLVEDDPLTQELVQDMLAEYSLLIATSGAEALRQCSEAPPDLLILDLNLVDRTGSSRQTLSGLELLRRLPGAVPFIVLTADCSRDTRQAAIRAGALAYWIKPPDPDNLVCMVEVALALAAKKSNWEREATIRCAVGILMALHKMDESEAQEAIRVLASKGRRKIYEIAQDIITAQTLLNQPAAWSK